MNNVQDFDYNLGAIGSLVFTFAVIYSLIVLGIFATLRFINLRILEPAHTVVYEGVRTMQTKPENRHVD